MQAETQAGVRAIIDRLPPNARRVVMLRDIEEKSVSETARILGISENAVKIRLHRARQALQALRGKLIHDSLHVPRALLPQGRVRTPHPAVPGDRRQSTDRLRSTP
jgi:hypothetical protein